MRAPRGRWTNRRRRVCRRRSNTARACPAPMWTSRPRPGTDTANPRTQISFLGTSAANVREVSVVGSRSGAHHGRLRGYSQGDGASFVLDEPFDAGERVSVRVELGGRRHRVQLPRGHAVPDRGRARVPQPAGGAGRLRELRHAAGRAGADPERDGARRRPRGGRRAHDERPGRGPATGRSIYTPQGRLVWFDQLSGGEAAEDLNEQTYEGRPALTWWRGRVLVAGLRPGRRRGHELAATRRSRACAGGNGLHADLHEFQIAADDVAYITAYNPIRCDLKPVQGARDGVDRGHGDPGDRHAARASCAGNGTASTTSPRRSPRPKRRRRRRRGTGSTSTRSTPSRTATCSSRRAARGRATSCRAAAAGSCGVWAA